MKTKGKNKILFLLSQPLNKRNVERFGLNYLQSLGYETIIWDLTKIMYPKVWQNIYYNSIQLKHNHRIFNSYLECNDLFFEIEDVFLIVDFLDYEPKQLIKLQNILISHGSKKIKLHLGSIPSITEQVNLSLIFEKALKNLKSIESLYFFCQKYFVNLFFKKSINNIEKSTFHIVSGRKSYYKFANKKIIKAHSFDYNHYLKIKDKKNQFEVDKYAVFLDANYAFHPDFYYMKSSPPATPENYYKSLNDFFDKVYKQINISIKIAAHPTTTKIVCDKYFNSRKVCFDKTAELIMNSEFVVCHSSTALQYAIIFNKPILFITTDEIEKVFSESFSIEKCAKELGKIKINIDKLNSPINWETELYVNFEKYSEYKENYIKMHNSQNENIWKIIVDYFLVNKLYITE